MTGDDHVSLPSVTPCDPVMLIPRETLNRGDNVSGINENIASDHACRFQVQPLTQLPMQPAECLTQRQEGVVGEEVTSSSLSSTTTTSSDRFRPHRPQLGPSISSQRFQGPGPQPPDQQAITTASSLRSLHLCQGQELSPPPHSQHFHQPS